MIFYQSIARYYDLIFPLNLQQVKFIVSSINGSSKDKSVLDIGCGTGSLSLALTRHFKRIVAVDLDLEMISAAKSKAKIHKNQACFMCLDMLEIEKHFSPAEFDLILSLGNTIVHLKNSEEIMDFFKQTKKLLKPGGKFLLQIVNYDRILEQDIQSLPLIKNETAKFERYYEYSPERNKIDFITVLTIDDKKLIIKNMVELYPMKKEEAVDLLRKAGFQNLFLYGNFKKETFSKNSLPLIIEAY